MLRKIDHSTILQIASIARFAEPDLVRAVKERDDDAFVIADNGQPVGYCLCVCGKQAYISIGLFDEYRSRALLEKVVREAEALVKENAERIMIYSDADDCLLTEVLSQTGYRLQFASERMQYCGKSIPVESCGTVRAYRAEDYADVHRLYADAFHRMRLSTGLFPESVPEPESEASCRYWAETADERLIFEVDGKAVGYAHIDGDEIGSISIAHDEQGKGYGRMFASNVVNAMLQRTPVVSLFCVVGNEKARALYLSLGFQTKGKSTYWIKQQCGRPFSNGAF